MEDGYRSLGAPGLGAQQATRTILDVLDGRSGLTVHLVSPGRINVSVSRRPRWAIAACVATIWIAGLGLLFLLVRRTDSGEITVSDGPRGCVVTLPPIIDAATSSALTDVLAPGAAPVLAPPIAPAPTDADDLEDRTVARREVLPPPPLLPPPPPASGIGTRPAAVELRFEAGTVRVEAGHPVILGREPSPSGTAVVRTVPGDASTVSKSHLRAEFDGTALTVEDLGSTNGSSIQRGGQDQPLSAGSPAIVAPGDRVSLGALTFVVAGGDADPEIHARHDVGASGT